MKYLNLILISIIIPFIYSCSKESDSPESTEQNASPSSYVKMSRLASDSTSCTYGGVKIEMGIAFLLGIFCDGGKRKPINQ